MLLLMLASNAVAHRIFPLVFVCDFLQCMIATVSPASFNTDETLSTLQYANRAKNIKNETHRNEVCVVVHACGGGGRHA